MKAGSTKVAGVFLASAIVAFVIALARPAPAAGTVYTFSGRDCTISGSGSVCGITGGHSISTHGGIAKVYFDFQSTGTGKLITNSIYKQTFGGTIYTDFTTATFDAGWHETNVTGSQVNVGSSQWDYYFADFVGPAGSGMTTLTNIFGVAIVTTN